tara:strand:+ start:270 stop:1127 length:858 start_codon:yes stop_codon:yes gene_type:complete
MDTLKEIIKEVFEEEGEEKKPQQPPQPPAEGGPIKLKINIPDSPFEDDEDSDEDNTATKVTIPKENIEEALPAVIAGVGRGLAMLGRAGGRAASQAGKAAGKVGKKGSKSKKGGGPSKNSMSDFGQDMANELTYDSFYQDDDSEEGVEENKITETKLREMIRHSIRTNLKKKEKNELKEDWRTEKNAWSSKEAKGIMDDSLRLWSKDLKQVKGRVVKDWMTKAKAGVLDFFDIEKGMTQGDVSRAHPKEVELLHNLLTRDKIMDRFRSYFGGKKAMNNRLAKKRR